LWTKSEQHNVGLTMHVALLLYLPVLRVYDWIA